MKNHRIVLNILLFLIFISVKAQLSSGTVMGLPTETIANINLITDAQQGAIAYATDTKKIYKFSGTAWEEIGNTNSSNTYMGVFIISKTGEQTIIDIPFQPSQISFVAHANVNQLTLDADNGLGDNNNTFVNTFGNANGFAKSDGSSPITQQNIFIGGSGNSINDISRYASDSHCIGIRYTNDDGDELGFTRASLTLFNVDGFTIDVDAYIDNLVVLYKASK